MVARGGVSTLSTLVANGLLLLGLLLWGWSLWTAIAALWVENLVEMPFLAQRIRRALDVLPPDQLATYLGPSDTELDTRDPEFPRERLRRILVGDPPATTARDARRHFLFFWIPFLAMPGIFVAGIGFAFGLYEHPNASPLDVLPFDGAALLTLAAGVLLAELATLWFERRDHPVMPDTSGFERRFILITLIVVLGGWVLGLIGPASRLIAAVFVVAKTIGDLRGGYAPQRFDTPVPS